MSTRKLQVFDQYRYGPRSVLTPGDRFRVGGGPVYVTDSGKVIPMYGRGEFVFRRFCIRGAAKWIKAYRADGGGRAILCVGRAGSRVAPNLRHRPDKITRVRGRKAGCRSR